MIVFRVIDLRKPGRTAGEFDRCGDALAMCHMLHDMIENSTGKRPDCFRVVDIVGGVAGKPYLIAG